MTMDRLEVRERAIRVTNLHPPRNLARTASTACSLAKRPWRESSSPRSRRRVLPAKHDRRPSVRLRSSARPPTTPADRRAANFRFWEASVSEPGSSGDSNMQRRTKFSTRCASIYFRPARKLQSVGQSIGTTLIKRVERYTGTLPMIFRVASSISKRYLKSDANRYWYAFHPQWDQFLREGKTGLFVLGCMDQSFAFSIPWNVLEYYDD